MSHNGRMSWSSLHRLVAVLWRLLFVCCCVSAIAHSAYADERPGNALQELARVRLATGGTTWDEVSRISALGEKRSFGLRGEYRSVEDLRNGFFHVKCDYEIFANAEGFDASGRWRQDNSGRIHPLDSVEAKEVALTEVYLAARGYLFPERMPATIDALDASREGTTTFIRVVATPAQGRAVTLWINASTHLIDRAVLDLSVGQKVIRFGDYRRVGSLTLPFSIGIEHRDENETGIASIRDYELATGSEQPELLRPSSAGSDVRMSTGSLETQVKGYLDRNSGFFIVLAAINDRGPYPFILDTGGHDILTPDAVRDLGLKTYGKGFSTGAGSGSMPTQFTKVESVAIGAATITGQPFTVLQIDLGLTHAPGGKRQRIAGILGLELFERFIIHIDYRDGTVILRPPGPLHYEPASAISLTFTSDMPLVQASIDGRSGWFDLDTGNNTDLIVFRQWAVAHEMMSLLSKAPLMQGSSVGGAIQMQKGRAQGFQIGNQKLSDIDFLLSSDQEGSLSAKWEAGNIGNEVLRHFRAVTLDYSSQRMYLE